jgi:UDPglucose 6-dehydrogenase
MKIGIIGLGFVGNAIKSFFKNKEELLLYDKYKEGGIGKFSDILPSDIVYLCLPTLYSVEKKSYDTIALTETIKKLNEENYSGIILIKSTVEPGFCENMNKKYKQLKIWHNPEFLTARTAVKDFANPVQIVLGCVYKRESYIIEKQILMNLHNKYFFKSIIKICTSNESETMKICVNSFYAVKIQFFNEIFDLCKKTKTDYNMVKELMLNNGWINNQHTDVPGHDGKLSYGGACFPKDTNALLQFMKSNNILHNVLKATIDERNVIRNNNISL